jgi:hypothetical protein
MAVFENAAKLLADCPNTDERSWPASPNFAIGRQCLSSDKSMAYRFHRLRPVIVGHHPYLELLRIRPDDRLSWIVRALVNLVKGQHDGDRSGIECGLDFCFTQAGWSRVEGNDYPVAALNEVGHMDSHQSANICRTLRVVFVLGRQGLISRAATSDLYRSLGMLRAIPSRAKPHGAVRLIVAIGHNQQ